LRFLGLDQLWGRPALISQCRVAREIGLRVCELGLIAALVGDVLVELGLVGARIDLRQEVADVNGLSFGEIDLRDLSLDLTADDDGVVSDDRADALQVDRHIVARDHAGHHRSRGGCSWSGRRPREREVMRRRENADDRHSSDRYACGNQESSSHGLLP
jgi:hypothetical protein